MELLQILIAAVLVGTSTCYLIYQDEVPNADTVPHPCKTNYLWKGLGHKNPLGGGPRNPFGHDFAAFHKWTEELCRMDSDGDGMTNGQELGDPSCKWTRGGTYKPRTTNITHPGVCDPWGSPQCAEQNKNVSCETGEFICDGINNPDVFNITLRFPPTVVPAKETTYMCFTFELNMLDPNEDYHLIATKPFIDNANVMHHISLTGCDSTSTALKEPETCNMAISGCQNNIGLWTLGMPGECVYKEAGFKIGFKAGYRRLNMQHHWTNPQLKTDYVDSSGMVIYLTRKLRPYNAGYLITGPIQLVLPPGMDRIMKTGTCTEECTRKLMPGPINILTGWNHMHYLGYQQNVEHFRNREKLRDLTLDEAYSYDSPVVHRYSPPVVVRPGDELVTTCIFKSTSRSTTTMFGEGTFDEMCLGIFTFYPAENMVDNLCTSWDDIQTCDQTSSGVIHNCSLAMIFDATHPTRKRLFSKIIDNCSYLGGCRRECPAAIAEVKEHPCFRGKMMGYISDLLRPTAEDPEVAKFLSALHSCECPNTPDPSWPASGAGTVFAGVFLLVLSAVFQKFV